MPNKRERAVALRWAIAYHESGHSVMASLAGRSFGPVSIGDFDISPDRGQNTPLARVSQPGKNENLTLDQSVAELQILMAGAISESLKTSRTSFVEQGFGQQRIKGREFLLSIRDGDDGQISRLVNDVCTGNPREQLPFLTWIFRRTLRSLTSHREWLDAVAANLVERGTILPDDVQKLRRS